MLLCVIWVSFFWGPKGYVFGMQNAWVSVVRKASAARQWWNFCRSKVAHGKTVLRINLDETSACVFQGDVKGNVFVSNKRSRDEPMQKISQGRRRCHFTHVGLICDRTDLQPLLPQVIVGNERTFKAGDM